MWKSDRRKQSRRLIKRPEICACKNELISPLTAVSKGIEMLFLDHGNWLSAIIGMTFMNILKA